MALWRAFSTGAGKFVFVEADTVMRVATVLDAHGREGITELVKLSDEPVLRDTMWEITKGGDAR